MLRAATRGQVGAPFGLELADIAAIDLGERREALVAERAAIGDPPGGGRRGKFRRSESRCRLDLRRGCLQAHPRACDPCHGAAV